jgi:YVTN family beta-propeller protein
LAFDRRELIRLGGFGALGLLAMGCAPAATPTVTPSPLPPKPTTAPPTPTAQAVPAATKPAAAATKPAAPATAAPTAAAAAKPSAGAGPETVYAFNVGSKDVTLIDAATRKVTGTKPLGAQVRWLSNEQTYWDGQSIWTYDFPDNKLQAIAIDPNQVAVSKTIADIGKGPAHSLVVLPDNKKAMVNVAGDNVVAFLDLPSGKIDGTMKTGAFP